MAHVPIGDVVMTSLGFRISPVTGAGTGVSAGNTDRGTVGRAAAPSPEASRGHGVREVARESEGQRTERTPRPQDTPARTRCPGSTHSGR